MKFNFSKFEIQFMFKERNRDYQIFYWFILKLLISQFIKNSLWKGKLLIFKQFSSFSSVLSVFFSVFEKIFAQQKAEITAYFLVRISVFSMGKFKKFLFSAFFSVTILNWIFDFFTTKVKFVQKFNVNLTPVKFWDEVYIQSSI